MRLKEQMIDNLAAWMNLEKAAPVVSATRD